MIAIPLRRALCAFAVFAMLLVAAQGRAACCGGWGTATSAYSANYPATYQTAYAGTGWYPGYWWDRINTRLWGSPSTYVAAYPTTTWAASYAPSYSASYAPAVTTASFVAPSACGSCSTCQSCTAGYSPCSTCGVQQVTLRPVCATACSPPCATCVSGCSTCSSCAGQVVTQASYEQPACATCNGSSPVHVQQEPPAPSPEPATPPPTFAQPSATGASEKPALPADSSVPGEQQQNKPPTNGAESQPGPGEDTGATPEKELYKVENTDSATMFQAPKLHDPNDRTALRSIAPVKNALYKQPVSYRDVSMRRVSAEQARQDAIGWTSASK